MTDISRHEFPADFRWGAATAAYQIEGAAREDGRGPSIWDTFSHTPGKVKGGDTGDVACDHYHRFEHDLDLMADLGLNAYRFSLSWPRLLQQGRGAANGPGLAFYERLVDGLLARGIEPWVTLYHWDLPQALQDAGGWGERDTIEAFVEYTDLASRRLGDRVKHWITHNEPWCTAFLGHHLGIHAPGERDLALALQVGHHVLVSHGRAVPVIRANVVGAQVGIAPNLYPAHPASAQPQDVAAALRVDGYQNRWFLDPLFGRGYPADMLAVYAEAAPQVEPGDLDVIGAPIDFLGVNYYSRHVVAHAPGEGPLHCRFVLPQGSEYTGFEWEVYPDGLQETLTRVAREYAPRALHVTENGATYPDVVTPDGRIEDEERRRFLERHLMAARSAVQAGVPLGGYFCWSLLDNFEWAEGYDKRFGLTHVDFDTQERRLKASGEWYRAFLGGERPGMPSGDSVRESSSSAS